MGRLCSLQVFFIFFLFLWAPTRVTGQERCPKGDSCEAKGSICYYWPNSQFATDDFKVCGKPFEKQCAVPGYCDERIGLCAAYTGNLVGSQLEVNWTIARTCAEYEACQASGGCKVCPDIGLANSKCNLVAFELCYNDAKKCQQCQGLCGATTGAAIAVTSAAATLVAFVSIVLYAGLAATVW